MERVDLINVYLQGMHIGLDVSMGLIVVVVIVLGLLLFLKFGTSLFDSFSPEIELNVPLGGLGSISIKTDYAVAQIAYTAWAELITRKAGRLESRLHLHCKNLIFKILKEKLSKWSSAILNQNYLVIWN